MSEQTEHETDEQDKYQLVSLGKMSPSDFVRMDQTQRYPKFVSKYKGFELCYIIALGPLSGYGNAYLYVAPNNCIATVDRHDVVLDAYRKRSNVYLPE